MHVADIIGSVLGPDVPVRVLGYDGSKAGPDTAEIAVRVTSPRALTRLATAPGSLGLARAYVAGEIEVEGNLYALLDGVADLTLEGLPRAERLRLARRLLRHAVRHPAARPESEFGRPRGRLHSKGRDSRAIAHHYDVSNSFYELVLGPSMAYTCAVYPTGDATLEQAQTAKFELVSRKLGLEPGMRLLDVGCGWGAMVMHAAAEHGVRALGVTLSRNQAQWAQAEIARRGLSDLAEVRHLDYRNTPAVEFDAVSSIGLTEHLGRAALPSYFAFLASRLRPGGRLLNHCITQSRTPATSKTDPFIDRYVFPDGQLHAVGHLITTMNDNGFEIRHEENLREHYALTLRDWGRNLDAHWDEAVAEVGEQRARVWRLYMAACRLAFARDNIQLHQVLGVVADGNGRSGFPLRGVVSRTAATVGWPTLSGVPDRLSPLDASFLFAEDRTTAMHVGGVMTFAPPEAGVFDVEAFVALIGSRLGLVPRYRQKVREVPGHLGLPVWVDDPDFELDYHLRRAALPGPGSDEQLRALVGRLLGRRLDRSRPLWEIYLVEGLSDGRFAVITKTHHAMVDGLASMDVGALLLDTTPVPRETAPDAWDPVPEPSGMELAIDAVLEAMRRPQTVLDVAARAGADAREVLANAERAVATLVSATGARPVHPLNAVIGEQRRFGTARAALPDHQAVRAVLGGTVNDVVLTVVAGGLRRWMKTRGEPLRRATTVRALVPVSVRPRRNGSGERAAAGNNISAYFVELPVGEPDPLCRLARVSAAMAAHKAGGQAVGATTLIRLAGFAPPTLHSLGVRLASQLSSQVYNVLVSNVPGPPRPLYAMGARMLDMYPVVPLAGGQAVAVGITSYDGVMHYGLNADRDAMPDVDVLAAAMTDALAELVNAATT